MGVNAKRGYLYAMINLAEAADNEVTTHKEYIISDDITMHMVVTMTDIKCGVMMDRFARCDSLDPCDCCKASGVVDPL